MIRIERFPLAKDLARAVAENLPPELPDATDLLAWTYFRSKDYAPAAQHALRTLELFPHSADARFNAAKCLNAFGQPERAEKLLLEALTMRKPWADAELELSVSAAMQGRFDESESMLRSIMAGAPEGDPCRDTAEYNLIWHDFRRGDFKAGVRRQLVARKLGYWGTFNRPMTAPRLEADRDLRDKTVLVCAEGGAGDEMIHMRFAGTLRERGARVVWLATPALASIAARVDGVSEVALRMEQVRYDYWVPAMDIPRALGLDVHEIPNAPFISALPSYVQKWRARVANGDRLKVGLRWQGNPLYETDLMRSVPFALLERLAEIPGVDLYSLQRDAGSEERKPESPVVDWGSGLETWEDTAGAIANLDLVISSCTSVPHLAGAMGKPVWLFCPLLSYYIWALPGDRSPWYRTVQLYRQERPGSWDEPFEAIRSALVSLAAQKKEGRPFRGAPLMSSSIEPGCLS